MKPSAAEERRLEERLRSLGDLWRPITPERLRQMATAATVAPRIATGPIPARRRPFGASVPFDRRRLARMALPAAAIVVVAAVFVAASVIRSSPAAAGVRFATTGRYIVATVTDPTASAEKLRAAFSEHHLDITLTLVPGSPSLVGTVVATEEVGPSRIEALQGGPCITGGGGCPIGLRIPIDYAGHAGITLARRAGPTEDYVATASAFAPGEPLHCSGAAGATVTHAARTIDGLGLHAIWRPYQDPADTRLDPSSVGSQFVIDAESVAPGEVMVWVSPTPVTELGNQALERYFEALSRDC